MKRKSIYFTTAVTLIVTAMMLAYIYPFAKSEPVSEQVGAQQTETGSSETDSTISNTANKKRTLESAEELRKFSLLGGTNSELALEENPGLGISKEFSIFAEEDVTFTGADTEGKVAAGGAVKATTDYKYQIGMKNKDDYSADIIVGNGPVENIALDFGYTDDGQTQVEDDKLIAYSSKATNMNLDDYTDEEKEHFVEADLIDFKSEFERLRAYSQELANKPATGDYKMDNYTRIGNYVVTTVNIDKLFKEANLEMLKQNRLESGISVLIGNDENCNVFNVEDLSSTILDVPEGSKVVINITRENVELDFGSASGNYQGLYYPLSKEKIAEIDIDDYHIVYVKTAGNLITDKEGNPQPFIQLSGGLSDINRKLYELSENVIINLPNATNLTLYDCGATVLAPNADVVTQSSSKGRFSGYLSGTLVCKSYKGNLQFGTPIRNISRKYKVNISKIDEQLKTAIEGAEFDLLDSEGNKIHSWTSTKDFETIELKLGTYVIKETKVPDGYETNVEDLVFTLNSDGSIVDKDGKQIAAADITFIEEYQDKTYTDHSVALQQEINYNTLDNIQIVESTPGINWDEITPNVENNTYTTNDGGKITVIENSGPYKFYGFAKKISTEYKNWDINHKIIIVKYNQAGDTEWTVFAECFETTGNSFRMGNVIETDDEYIITGGLSSHIMFIDASQTVNNKSIVGVASGHPGPPTSTIIGINKEGKVEIAKLLPIIDEGTIDGNLSKSIIAADGYLYAKSSSFNDRFVKAKIKPETINQVFPYDWESLCNQLPENAGNITDVSFDIDTSEASQCTERDLYIIVAENNGQLLGSQWMEFVSYKLVEDGDTVTTTIPLVEEVYTYYGIFDDESVITLNPHFYRQTMGSTDAEEVYDINIKNIKAHWKEVQYLTKEKTLEVSLKNIEPITITNKKITEEPKEEEPKDEEPKQEEPKEEPKQQEPINQVQTGDTIYIALIILGLAAIGCGATFILKQ